MTVSFTFGTTFRRLRLNSPPLVLYLTGSPTWQSWKAYVSMVENTVLKSVGARTQPCFTPFITGKPCEWSQSSGTLTIMQSWNCRTIIVISLRQPNFSIIFPSRLCAGQRRSQRSGYWLFSWSWRAANIMSADPRSERKPHWLSGRRHWARCWMRGLSRMRVKILPAKQRIEIPWWLSLDRRLPFLWTMLASFNCCGTFPALYLDWNSSVSFSASWLRHLLCTLQQGFCLVLALCQFHCLSEFLFCGQLVKVLIALSLISAGWLRSSSKRSAYLSKMCLLSVSGWVPSALRRGEEPEYCGPWTVFKAS